MIVSVRAWNLLRWKNSGLVLSESSCKDVFNVTGQRVLRCHLHQTCETWWKQRRCDWFYPERLLALQGLGLMCAWSVEIPKQQQAHNTVISQSWKQYAESRSWSAFLPIRVLQVSHVMWLHFSKLGNWNKQKALNVLMFIANLSAPTFAFHFIALNSIFTFGNYDWLCPIETLCHQQFKYLTSIWDSREYLESWCTYELAVNSVVNTKLQNSRSQNLKKQKKCL